MRRVIFDLDDTLSDARWRMNLWGNWDAFYQESEKDEPIKPMCRLFRLLALSYDVAIVTAREEKYRLITTRWLMKHDLRASSVLMRPNGNYQKSPDLKEALVETHLGWENIELVIDDRDDVLTRFRSRGITTLQATYPNGSRFSCSALPPLLSSSGS